MNWLILCKENQSLISLGKQLPKFVTRTGETSLGELSLENLRILKILMLFVDISAFATSASGMSVGISDKAPSRDAPFAFRPHGMVKVVCFVKVYYPL